MQNSNILSMWLLGDILVINTYALNPGSPFPFPPFTTEQHTSGFLPSACVIQGWLLFIFNLGMCDSKPA